MTTFQGYTPEALTLLDEIGAADREWFTAHKKEYQRLIAEPSKEYVSALGEELSERLDTELTAIPRTNGSLSPINNDLRFNPDRPPYKDNIMVRIWQGPEKKTAPTLFVRITKDEVGFASGITLDGPQLARWREAVAADSGATLVDDIQAAQQQHPCEVVGETLKRVPAPYPADHPRADLLKFKYFQIRYLVPATPAIHSAEFVPWCADQFEPLFAIHRWLVDHMTG